MIRINRKRGGGGGQIVGKTESTNQKPSICCHTEKGKQKGQVAAGNHRVKKKRGSPEIGRRAEPCSWPKKKKKKNRMYGIRIRRENEREANTPLKPPREHVGEEGVNQSSGNWQKKKKVEHLGTGENKNLAYIGIKSLSKSNPQSQKDRARASSPSKKKKGV